MTIGSYPEMLGDLYIYNIHPGMTPLFTLHSPQRRDEGVCNISVCAHGQ